MRNISNSVFVPIVFLVVVFLVAVNFAEDAIYTYKKQQGDKEKKVLFDRWVFLAQEASGENCSSSPIALVFPPEGLDTKPVVVELGHVHTLSPDREFMLYQHGDVLELRRFMADYSDYYKPESQFVVASVHLPGSQFCREQFEKTRQGEQNK